MREFHVSENDEIKAVVADIGTSAHSTSRMKGGHVREANIDVKRSDVAKIERLFSRINCCRSPQYHERTLSCTGYFRRERIWEGRA